MTYVHIKARILPLQAEVRLHGGFLYACMKYIYICFHLLSETKSWQELNEPIKQVDTASFSGVTNQKVWEPLS